MAVLLSAGSSRRESGQLQPSQGAGLGAGLTVVTPTAELEEEDDEQEAEVEELTGTDSL